MLLGHILRVGQVINRELLAPLTRQLSFRENQMILNKPISTLIMTSAIAFGLPTALLAQPTSQGSQQAKQERPNVAEFDKQSTQVQENFKKMQEQVDQIRTTKNPQERQKLLEEHWTTMQANSNLMGGMWGPGMMGFGGGPGSRMGRGHMNGWSGMGGYYSKMTPEELKQRQYMTEQYMDMQQNMMNQMMQQNYLWINPGR